MVSCHRFHREKFLLKKKLIKVGAKKKIAIIINEFPSQGKPFFFSCLLTVRNVSSHYPFDSCLSLLRQDRQWQPISWECSNNQPPREVMRRQKRKNNPPRKQNIWDAIFLSFTRLGNWVVTKSSNAISSVFRGLFKRLDVNAYSVIGDVN